METLGKHQLEQKKGLMLQISHLLSVFLYCNVTLTKSLNFVTVTNIFDIKVISSILTGLDKYRESHFNSPGLT